MPLRQVPVAVRWRWPKLRLLRLRRVRLFLLAARLKACRRRSTSRLQGLRGLRLLKGLGWLAARLRARRLAATLR